MVLLIDEGPGREGVVRYPEQAEWIEQRCSSQRLKLERIWHAVWRFKDERSIVKLVELLQGSRRGSVGEL